MQHPDIFDPATTEANLARLDNLKPTTIPQWGKMNVGQMLAHLNVGYAIDTGRAAKQNFLMRFLLKKFAKPTVVGPKPYPKNGRTAPIFIITDERDFVQERDLLVANIQRVESTGRATYEGRTSASFGDLTADEWSILFQKHLDHHLTQFGV